MPKTSDRVMIDLEELLLSKVDDVVPLDSSGKNLPTANGADLIQFHFHKNGKDYGTVTVSIDGLKNMTVYYDDKIASSGVNEDDMDADRGMNGTSWISLVKQLKKFAQRHQLGFVLKDTDRLRNDMKKRTHQKALEESSQLKDDLEFMTESSFKKFYGVGKREFVAEGWKQKVGAAWAKIERRKAAEKKGVAEGSIEEALQAPPTSTGNELLDEFIGRYVKDGWKYHGTNKRGGHEFRKRRYMPAALYGLKDGGVIESHNNGTRVSRFDSSGKRVAKLADGPLSEQGVAEDNQMKLGEIGFANELGKLQISDDQIIANSTVDGRMSTREVMIFTSGSNRLYFFTDGKKIDALVLLDGKRIAAMKGSVKGLVYALFKYLTDIKRLKMMIGSDDLVTTFGIDWLANQISRPGGIKITNGNGQPVDANELKREWLVSRSDPDRRAGPTSLMIGESSDGKRLRKNEQSLMPYDIFGVSMKSEKLDEGYYGNKKMSYNDDTPTVKMIIKHNKQIEETDQRFRHIEKIFLETSNGERFVVETTKPSRARMFARHIAEGGGYKDERWNHIKELCEDIDALGGFIRATRSSEQFNESAQRMIGEVADKYSELKTTAKRLQTGRGYNSYFESYKPSTKNEDNNDLLEVFKHSSVDSRIERALPTLNKLGIRKGILEEADIFEQWAESVIDESLDVENGRRAEDLVELFNDELPVGPNAEVAIAELGDIIEDDDLYNRLRRVAAVDPNNDARPQIIAWMQEQDTPEYRNLLSKLKKEDGDSPEDKEEVEKSDAPKSIEPAKVAPKKKKPNPAGDMGGGLPPLPGGDDMSGGLPPLPPLPPLKEGDSDLASFKRLIGK